MSNNSKNIFSSYWFVSGLIILLMNDFFLKETFHNWFTGKLSDFAGLFVFALFWIALFPKHKLKVLITTGIIFILWKSPLSQSFIDGFNSMNFFAIDRVVDFTDLLALSILPLAFLVAHRTPGLRKLRLSPSIPIVAAAFAFGATSYSTNEELNKSYTVNTPKDSLLNRLNRLDSVSILKNNALDTIDVSIQNELCHDNINVKLTVSEINESTTAITILNATHPCPRKEVKEKDILESFENRIVNNLK
tara:strand:+ start:15411 stop:16154 length:744 start_codon:yes stop_codon:yes gene_type:complete